MDKDSEPENINLIIDDLYSNVQIEEQPSPEENEDVDKDLDTSWINEHERLSSVGEKYLREPMDSINLYFIYINRNLYIEKITTDKQPLQLSEDKKYSYLPKETLLQIIQTKKVKTQFSKYKLIDIISYLVDLDPEHIQSYSKNENLVEEEQQSPFFKTIPFTSDIKVPPSIFIFHEINAVYFIFQEVELLNNRHTLKSILKNSLQPSSSKSNTKKVRIQLNSYDNSIKKNNKGTRKQR
jgi:hypothetical protein